MENNNDNNSDMKTVSMKPADTCDIDLIISTTPTTTIKAHKQVLAAHSNYFATFLSGDNNVNEVTLDQHIVSTNANTMVTFIECIYSNNAYAKMTASNTQSIAALAFYFDC